MQYILLIEKYAIESYNLIIKVFKMTTIVLEDKNVSLTINSVIKSL